MRFTLDDDQVVLQASAREIDLMTAMLGQFGELLETRTVDPHRGELTPVDPALRRLLPDPVHDDAEAAADLRSLTEASLISHKQQNAASVGDVLTDARIAPAALDPESELALLKTLTDLRIVLAARLGIEKDGDHGRRWSPNDFRLQGAYHWLASVQADLLDAIAKRTR